MITFDTEITGDFDAASRREWLQTNGLGGWSSSTVSGAHTRRYHGLLVAAMHPPVDRRVLLSSLDETLLLRDERIEIACHLYPGVIHPAGFEYMTAFAQEVFPSFAYAAAGLRLIKSIAMVYGEHTVVIRYQLEGEYAVQMDLVPLFAGRDYHHLMSANPDVVTEARFEDGVLAYRPFEGQPDVHLSVPGGRFAPTADWYYNFEYTREADRGLDFTEDLLTPGTISVELEPDRPLHVIASTLDTRGRNGAVLMENERERRQGLTASVPSARPLFRHLLRAADDFVVRRGDRRSTILAGYHWFTDWGRDTMIALPGLCLVTGRFDEARNILLAFAEHISEGMIPNRFPDAGEEPDYNTVDATLWFFVAVHKYLEYTDDEEFVRGHLWRKLLDIISWHRRGTRFGIRVDGGLVTAGEEGVQLTWMDAKVGNWVVTPRTGKAIEINALWYNSLRIVAALCERFDLPVVARDFDREAVRVGRMIDKTFWYERGGYLYDVVDGNDKDPSLRPNQLLALSLPFAVPLTGDRAARALATVEHHLLTPYGLRSLAPDDPAYQPSCVGPPLERDGAYHQGTVWSWLIGPFITALVRVRGEEGRRQGRAIVEGFERHLSEACVGSISEVFDGDEPHSPRGCVAQAWSVAELLRVAREDLEMV